MREETSRWLTPLIEEADRRDMDIKPLMKRATMPYETASPIGNWMSQMGRDDRVTFSAIDWIKFGQLLADKLGWRDYPREPDETTGG